MCFEYFFIWRLNILLILIYLFESCGHSNTKELKFEFKAAQA